MRTFKIRVAEDTIIPIRANSVEEARKIARAQIYTKAASPLYDKLFFDYEIGVPNVQGLRSQLGRAETLEEQDAVLTSKVGSKGFTRNTKGQAALTPEGLKKLGLHDRVKTVTLTNGDVLPVNVIVDENSFGLSTGDLADFSGVVGPIAGAVAFMSPYGRIGKYMLNLFKGRPRLSRVIAAGSGSATGKGAEELLDAMQGFQLQDKQELAATLAGEFALGAVGQGLGEGLGIGYQLLLGKKAPFDNLRLYEQATKRRSLNDIMKLDQKLGREATEAEIKQAIKTGAIRIFAEAAVPSQSALNKQIPGRLQAVSEQVLGNERTKSTTKYLTNELNNVLESANLELSDLETYISATAKGSLDEQLQANLQVLRSNEAKTTQTLRKLLQDVEQNVFEMGKYADSLDNQTGAIGANIRETLTRAYKAIDDQHRKKYVAIDKSLQQLGNNKIDQFYISEDIGRLLYPRLVTLEKQIAKFKKNNLTYDLFKVEDSATSTVQSLEEFIKRFKERIDLPPQLKGMVLKSIQDDVVRGIEESGRNVTEAGITKAVRAAQKQNYQTKLDEMLRTDPDFLDAALGNRLNLVQVRNAVSDLKKANNEAVIRGVKSNQLANALNDFEQFLYRELPDSKNFISRVSDKGLGKKEVVVRLEKQLKELQEANASYADRMSVFRNKELGKMKSETRQGSYDIDEIYQKAVVEGSFVDLRDLFKGLKDYDGYLNTIKKSGKQSKEDYVKTNIQRRLFLDAADVATDPDTGAFDFHAFSREILNFEKKYPGKLDMLFETTGAPLNLGRTVVRNLEQLNKLKPNLKPRDILELADDFTDPNALRGSIPGTRFVEKLKELADASNARLRFEQNKLFQDLPTKSLDETVDIIFRPNSAYNINLLKQNVTPEVFDSIKNASMTKILKNAVDLNGKGNITDIFKPGNLKSSLDSYGDETLTAMFGKETTRGLRNFQKEIDILTRGEVGTGGAAGTLIAAGIAVNAFNIQMLPTIAGLAIMRNVLSRPGFVGFMARRDKGSILKVLDAFEQAARQLGIRLVASGGEAISEAGGDFIEGVSDFIFDQEETQQILDQSKGLLEDVQQTELPKLQTNIELPEITPIQQTEISPERLALAEALSGRRII